MVVGFLVFCILNLSVVTVLVDSSLSLFSICFYRSVCFLNVVVMNTDACIDHVAVEGFDEQKSDIFFMEILGLKKVKSFQPGMRSLISLYGRN